MTATPANIPPRRAHYSSSLRWLLPIVLVLFFLAILIWLPWQARQMESNERQEQLIADTLWVEQTIRFQLARDEESLRGLGVEISAGRLPPGQTHERLARLLKNGHELLRVIWLRPDGALAASSDPQAAPVELSEASKATMELARKTRHALYTQPEAQTPNLSAAPAAVLMDYHVPLFRGDDYIGDLVATYQTSALLEEMVPWWFAQDNQVSLIDRDDKVLARRAAAGPGHGVYTHKRALDLPGATITLVTDSVKSEPRLLPNLLVGSVIVLSLGLLWSLVALWGHISRRLAAEGALRQQMSFRTAMENSLVTGLRARDLEGRITYVNPAFCQIVGYPAEEIVGMLPPMPYWAPEAMAEYQTRFASVLAGKVTPQFETIFQRPDGERVPVLIFEAPLVDKDGKQTGWMGSILDISDRKRIEELNRQQHEKLQASARLATMGEISSMLAHELNQPLAAISSYTTGALNVLARADSSGAPVDCGMLKPALEQASAQAQRAGQIIRSVHEFVKKSEPQRQEIGIASLLDGIRTLIELQARQAYVAFSASIPADLPPVRADRVMIEQVLLNLTRNAIEAMAHIPPQRRMLNVVAAYDAANAQVSVAVIDQGHGIPEEVAQRLFSPFFSTKAEGMGMGLNICRTAIEFHGGALTHSANPQGGTIFTFTLPAVLAAAEQET
ncbi:two-component system sensor histidine kinase NtrB [Duganella violaceipulchra]|uniref:histidine kinase n=1 Tax=Duganella violaceipulchra TaxID=2849652 RepID=A0AA41H5A8_9BURK|nr:PAS domain S-box protein [Duganella violaceicalia]MBV6320369.1 PAS domain S-box protein [Duganella violaceicalia]MCP2011818.1 two-component system sensor histidine kinase DctS [Duganella violaceicalia]